VTEPPRLHPSIYFCPQARENECPNCGGFDVCCDRPGRHREPKLALDWYSTDLKDDLDRYIAEASKDPAFAKRLRWHSLTPVQRARVLRVERISRRTARRAERRTR
jgi:hypothetical protein